MRLRELLSTTMAKFGTEKQWLLAFRWAGKEGIDHHYVWCTEKFASRLPRRHDRGRGMGIQGRMPFIG
jgi:hypothetical protein